MKTYYIDEYYNVIPNPGLLKLGQSKDDPFVDCEYMLFHTPKKCPNDSDYTENCPILIGYNVCDKAKKCKLIIIYGLIGDKRKTKQLPLFPPEGSL